MCGCSEGYIKTWIIEHLMEEVRLQKQVKDSSDFQEYSNLVENFAVTVENAGKKSHFTSSIEIREWLKRLPVYLRLLWGQHM
jgi:DNA-binding GntR family transcriptional regulator